MPASLTIVLRAAGIGLAAGIQPILVLVAVVFAARTNTVHLVSPYNTIATTPVLIILLCIFALHLFHRYDRSGFLSGLVHLLQFPLALAAGAFGVLAAWPSVGDPLLALFVGAAGAGITHGCRAFIRRIARSRIFSALEFVLAGFLLFCAAVAPWLSPLLFVIVFILGSWATWRGSKRLLGQYSAAREANRKAESETSRAEWWDQEDMAPPYERETVASSARRFDDAAPFPDDYGWMDAAGPEHAAPVTAGAARSSDPDWLDDPSLPPPSWLQID